MKTALRGALLAILIFASGNASPQASNATERETDVASDEEEAPGASPRILLDRISPRLQPARVIALTLNAFESRHWEVADESSVAFVARHRQRDKEAVMRVSFADQTLRYVDETTFENGAQRAVVPASWLKEIRMVVARTIARASVQAAAKTTGIPSDRTIFLRVPAALDPQVRIAEAVESECQVEEMFATRVYRGMRRRYAGPLRTSTEAERREREIHLTILEASGVGPGGWTRKTVRIRADLVQHGENIASAVFDRGIGGRGSVRQRRACDILGNAALNVGVQIATWAAHALGARSADASETEDDVDDPGESPKS